VRAWTSRRGTFVAGHFAGAGILNANAIADDILPDGRHTARNRGFLRAVFRGEFGAGARAACGDDVEPGDIGLGAVRLTGCPIKSFFRQGDASRVKRLFTHDVFTQNSI
jgi:hypothetical protein